MLLFSKTVGLLLSEALKVLGTPGAMQGKEKDVKKTLQPLGRWEYGCWPLLFFTNSGAPPSWAWQEHIDFPFRRSYLYTFIFVSFSAQDCQTSRKEKERRGLWNLSASTGMLESQRGAYKVGRTHNNFQDSFLIFLLNFWPSVHEL